MDPIAVTIDPHAPLPERYLGASEDGPQYGPMSLVDAIIETAAQKLVAQAKDDAVKEGYKRLVDHMKGVRDELIREAVAPEIADALSKPLRKTNQYGEETGAETTLRELIAEQVRTELSNPADRFGSSRGLTVLQKVIHEEVDRALRDELKEALNAGKAQVLAAVRKEGTAVLERAMAAALPS